MNLYIIKYQAPSHGPLFLTPCHYGYIGHELKKRNLTVGQVLFLQAPVHVRLNHRTCQNNPVYRSGRSYSTSSSNPEEVMPSSTPQLDSSRGLQARDDNFFQIPMEILDN